MKTSEQRAFVYPKLEAGTEAIRQYADSVDGITEWNYMNYGDESQDVLRSYGTEKVKKMRDAAAKYDPQQVFQKLCPGGWKISDLDL